MSRTRRRGEDDPDPRSVRLLAGRYRASGDSSGRHSGKLGSVLDRYLEEISRYPLIDRDEEGVLAVKIREGDAESLERLIRANLRFVVSVAKKYQNRGVPLADLINEGNVGLIRAAHKFDETRGTRFISYAVWWIRQGILQALADQGRIVRVPLNRASTVHRIS
ncbi:MAG: sigma-70 family RNA polymerase sigma factor, partial [Gemmatimonadota bacterium]